MEENETAPLTFTDELMKLLNKHDKDSQAGTPDYILAHYLNNCLTIFTSAVNDRDGENKP